MVKKSSFKKIIISLFAILLIFGTLNTVNAFDADSIFTKADNFISKGESGTGIDEQEIADIFVPIAQILVRVGTIILAIAVVVLGIQYMVSSPDKKAMLKDKLVGLTISAIIIGGAQVIWALLISFFN